MRPLGIKLLNEGVEFPLLLQDVGASRACGLFFQCQMHAFVPAVLLGMTRPDPFDRDAQP